MGRPVVRVVIIGTLVGALALGAAVWSRDGEPDDRSVVSGEHSWAGLSRVPFALSHASAVEWTGKVLVVFGGNGYRSGRLTPVDEGAVFDPALGEWRSMPQPPVRALYSPAAVADGSVVFITGVACNGGLTESATTTCDPGQIASLAFDVESNRWSTVATPPGEVFDGAPGRVAPTVKSVGFDGRHAVFSINGDVWALQTRGRAWRPMPTSRVVAGASCRCASPLGAVGAVAHHVPDVMTGQTSSSPGLELAISRAGGPFIHSEPLTSVPSSPLEGCAGGGIVVVDGRSTVGDLLDLSSGTSRALPPLPFKPVRVGNRTARPVVFGAESVAVLAEGRESGWIEFPLKGALSASSVVDFGGGLVVLHEDESGEVVLEAAE
jgi:hypothetical protein